MSRISIIERDLSGFTNTLINSTGAMVLKSAKGKRTPMYIQSKQDVLTLLGKPSAEYHGVFEAISFTKEAPLWVSCAVADDALYGGVDVGLDFVTGFGVGRDWDTFNYGTVIKAEETDAGTGDGVEVTFTGTIANVPITQPDTFKVYVGGVLKDVTCDVLGNLTGDAISAGTVNLTSGVYLITFDGVPGTYAEVVTDIDGSTGYDLSLGGTDKYIKIMVDGVIETINLGQSSTRAKADIITDINTAFGKTVATSSTDFIAITGSIGRTSGNVSIDDPDGFDSALDIVFSTAGTALTDVGSGPTGSIPKYNEKIELYSQYQINATLLVSHSFFTTSPYQDDLAIKVSFVSGSRFTATLYQKYSRGYSEIDTYNYSLIQEKDAFGKSLYFADVFNENPYIQVKKNTSFVEIAYDLSATITVDFSGGTRGSDPLNSDYQDAWNNFRYGNKYKAKIFMDVYGTQAFLVNSIIQTYQEFAQGITCVPLGYSASAAVSYRSSLGLDSDDISLYHNWMKIQDDYNNSFAWISGVGSIGKKFAMMADVYDAASPAGIDENGHGGQLSDWRVLEMEIDYTPAELTSFYNAQINPIIFDEAYGVMAKGDQTLQVTNSDTSFIGTRRVYKYILEVVSKQILRKQEFKINDPLHRLMAKVQTDEFIQPIASDGWIREFRVVCDQSNNNDTVLNNREFILDLYIKITPNSQWIKLRLTRVGQSVNIEDLI